MADSDHTNQLNSLIADGRVYDVAALLDSEANVNGNGSRWSPLLTASEHEQPEIIRLLVSRGADINLGNENGWTPLHNAIDVAIDGAAQCQLPEIDWECVGLFLDLGGDPLLKCKDGKTPLDIVDDYGTNARDSFDSFMRNRVAT